MSSNPSSEWLPEVSEDEIVIDPVDIDAEANGNLWTFSVTFERAAALVAQDIEAFINAIAAARSRQLLSRKSPPMLLYCWHDEMAGQLRFSLVSESHGHLPFRCAIEQTESLHAIAACFLQSPYLEGIPWSEVTEVPPSEDLVDDPVVAHVLPVWVTRLPSSKDGFGR